MLKSHDWDVERAVNAHYSSNSSSGPSPTQQNIRKIFDTYRDDATNEPDKISFDGVIRYFKDIDVALDDVSFVTLFDLLDAPAMGELSREGFVTGWTNVSSPSNSCDTIDKQRLFANVLRDRMSNDPSYFRQIYKTCFKYAKPEGQRAVPVEQAFAFWDMFFGGAKNGIDWNSGEPKWYDLWRDYYTTKNNRPVNKDLWNQVAELVAKTRGPGGERLEWWSEDGAWPTAVDDFVAFVKEKRAAGGMDTS